jgi:hypothetical protein
MGDAGVSDQTLADAAESRRPAGGGVTRSGEATVLTEVLDDAD